MAFINIVDLTFGYDGSSDNVFENVSFRMDTDWRLGFTGRNGRGKTTFLRLLMELNKKPAERKYEYSGTISASNVKFEYFPYDVNMYDNGAEEWYTYEIAEQILPDCMEPQEIWKLFREMSLLEVDEEVLYRPYTTLSYGERTKVMLALLFLKENSFLLIDEPTNHLDMHAREILGEYLKKKSGFILVSHDRRLLDTAVDHILAINKTNIEIQQGNFSSWWENKQRQDAHELAENDRLKKDIGRLKQAAKQAGSWADKAENSKIGHKKEVKNASIKDVPERAYIGEKSRRMQQQRKNLENRQERSIEEKSKLLKNLETVEDLKLFPMEYRSDRLVQFTDVSIYYGEKLAAKDVSFEVCRGDRIALSGRNGCGKSSVLKLLLGVKEGTVSVNGEFGSAAKENMTYDGILHLGSQLVVSYVPQDASHLRGSISNYAETNGIDAQLLNMLLRKLDFSRAQLEKNMEDFSEGQKKKVLLAASLVTRAHLYVWDEPLNYIDVFSRMQIEDLILKYQPTLLFVEHDREFTEKIATKVIRM